MNIATTKENKKAMKFLKNAAFLPIYLASKEIVIIPTKVSVETSAATWGYPAPLLSKVSAVEKATNVGIKTIDPTIDDKNTPKNPDSEPISLEIVSASNIDKIKPTIIIIDKNWGIIFSKDLKAFFSALLVLGLSFINETIIKIIAKL